jgi:hypothetical protein
MRSHSGGSGLSPVSAWTHCSPEKAGDQKLQPRSMRVRQNRMRNINKESKKMNERKIKLERGSVIDIGSNVALDMALDRYERLSVAAKAVSDAYETLSDGALEKAIWKLREVIEAPSGKEKQL